MAGGSPWHNFTSFLLTSHVGRLTLVGSVCAVIFAVCRLLAKRVPREAWQALALSIGAYVIYCYAKFRRRNQLRTFMGTSDAIKRIYGHMESAKAAPRPPFWAFDPFVQFIPWVIYNLLASILCPIPFEAVPTEVKGLRDKTKPEGPDNPRDLIDEVIVNYYPPTTGDTLDLALDAPIVLIEPGLTCTRQDVPGSALMRLAVARGFRAVVVERRAHGQPLKSPRWNLFGDADDLEQVYSAIRRRLPDAPLFWVGISSGAKIIIEGLGKYDRRRANGDNTAPRFAGGCCICPGYNLETCFLKFAWPMSTMCLRSTQDKFMVANEAVLRAHDEKAYDRAMAAPNLQVFLAAVAPFAGYPDAKAYFENENPVLFCQDITTPCLIMNAEDDPMTVIGNAFVPSLFHEGNPTFVNILERSQNGMLLLPTSGSHCPFLDGTFFPFALVPRHLGGLVISNWGERCAIEFFEGVLIERSKTE